VGLLEQACRGLVDISGQHEHVSLLDPELHLTLLDGYAGLHGELARYREVFDLFSARLKEKQSLAMDDAERARRLDYLAFQIEEIDRIDPKPAEDEQLALERKRLSWAGKLKGSAEEAERLLYSGEESACDQLGKVLSRLAEAAGIDPALEPVVRSLKSAQVEMEESSRTLSAYARGVESDPTRLSEVEERLEALKRLSRKHAGDLARVLARQEEMKREREGVERHAERLAALGEECLALGKEALARARELSLRRAKAAREFAAAVESELGRLAMGKTFFQVALEPAPAPGSSRIDRPKAAPPAVPWCGGSSEEGALAPGNLVEGALLSSRGLDRCELMLSPNPGEEAKPLSRIASGGELSRVMLAIKRALARTDPVPTYVFDEVDSGIGGAVAEVVGRLLREVSRERQVLCITHLPQIAACAEHHFTVEKRVREGRTVSRVESLSAAARAHEIARMLAGVEVTPAALRNAEEMLEAAGRKRRRG
jgi:DNA repair protein RecN (Recombination protein N)